MATTAPRSRGDLHLMTDNRSMIWGALLGLVLAVAIILSMRTVSTQENLLQIEAAERSSAIEKVDRSEATDTKMPDTVPLTNPTDSTQPSR